MSGWLNETSTKSSYNTWIAGNEVAFLMTQELTPQQTITALRAGPGTKAKPISPEAVLEAAEKLPKSYAGALSAILYRLADSQLKSPGKNTVQHFESFTQPWLSALSDDRARYLTGYLDVFSKAVQVGLQNLDWKNKDHARELVEQLLPQLPEVGSVQGLAWLPMIGQLQSTYSRDDAAETFSKVQQHEHSQLIVDFYWDTGALTYYSEAEIQERRRDIPSLSRMRRLSPSDGPNSDKAVVISVDPNFFRIYGPMILFNAQQLTSIDFVLILCAEEEEGQHALEDAHEYLQALSKFNKQPVPQNLRIQIAGIPEWVGDKRTFYACARFLGLPELLDQYETIYAMDADLFMIRDPQPFMEASSNIPLSVPETQGLLGVPPWRRYMAGNMVVNREFAGSTTLERLVDYLSVGLAASSSWMLDQNAISYAVERGLNGEFERMSKARPAITATFMRLWERNYMKATR